MSGMIWLCGLLYLLCIQSPPPPPMKLGSFVALQGWEASPTARSHDNNHDDDIVAE